MERRDTSTNELQEWYCSTQNCCQVTHFFLVLAFHQFAASHVEFAKSIHKNEEKKWKNQTIFLLEYFAKFKFNHTRSCRIDLKMCFLLSTYVSKRHIMFKYQVITPSPEEKLIITTAFFLQRKHWVCNIVPITSIVPKLTFPLTKETPPPYLQ